MLLIDFLVNGFAAGRPRFDALAVYRNASAPAAARLKHF
jgi:hypothetical protein|tara:strand:- start:254 stop:370 length:117 start_codon:yes stop_codon:yes gene_type:complete